MKTLILASAMLLGVTTVASAQSLTNFGPNAPSYGDSYGKPVAGTYPPLQKRGYGAYAYQPRFYHRHCWWRYGHRHCRW